MEMSRVWAMPNKDTFDVKPIGEFVKKYLVQSKVSVDPFARNKRWATHTNDLNPETQAEHHLDVHEFLEMMVCREVKADLVLFDPPYSLRQTKEIYESIGRHFSLHNSQNVGGWTKERRLISQILTPQGVCLSFGWNSRGLGKQNGMRLEEVLLVCHGGAHNDTICIAERRL